MRNTGKSIYMFWRTSCVASDLWATELPNSSHSIGVSTRLTGEAICGYALSDSIVDLTEKKDGFFQDRLASKFLASMTFHRLLP